MSLKRIKMTFPLDMKPREKYVCYGNCKLIEETDPNQFWSSKQWVNRKVLRGSTFYFVPIRKQKEMIR